MQVLGQEEGGGAFSQDDDGRQLLGCGRDAVAVGPKHLTGLLGGIQRHTGQDLGSHRVQAVLEAGHDAEVAAASLRRPEEVGVLVWACTHGLPFGGDHFAATRLSQLSPCFA